MKKEQVILFSVLAGSVILSAFVISNARIRISDVTPSRAVDGTMYNVISVSGDGKVYATPDVAIVRIAVSMERKKSKDAFNEVSSKIKVIKRSAKQLGIKDEDVQTADISVYPKYNYDGGEGKIVGYTATQTLSIKVRGIDRKNEYASEVVDTLSGIDNVLVQDISFDIEDKTSVYSEARELAYKKASQKARELAQLAGLTLGKAISISEGQNITYPQRVQYFSNTLAKEAADSGNTGGTISSGQLEIHIVLSINYEIK